MQFWRPFELLVDKFDFLLAKFSKFQKTGIFEKKFHIVPPDTSDTVSCENTLKVRNNLNKTGENTFKVITTQKLQNYPQNAEVVVLTTCRHFSIKCTGNFCWECEQLQHRKIQKNNQPENVPLDTYYAVLTFVLIFFRWGSLWS